MRTIYKILGVVAALAVFAVGTAVVIAQTQSDDSRTTVETIQQEIVEAMQATRDEVIATAVTDGRLTEQQAGQMQSRMLMNRGQMGPMRGQMAGPMAGNCCGLESPLLDRTAMHTRLAELLGMSLDELEAAMAEGARLSQLMADADVDAETVRAAMTEVRETAVAEALADGTITQEQADCVLSKTDRGPHLRGLNNHNHDNGRQQNHGRMGPRNGNP
jgi:hypothetical protein